MHLLSVPVYLYSIDEIPSPFTVFKKQGEIKKLYYLLLSSFQARGAGPI